MRCVLRRQHYTTDVVRAQRIHRDGRDDGGIDPAGKAQQNLGKTGLAHVVAQRQHHDAVILVAPLKVDMTHDLIEGRHLQRELAAGIEGKGCAVKDLIVLTADHIEVNQRKSRLHHAGYHHVQPGFHLAAVIGRAVGHQEKLGPRLLQRFGDIGMPCIFADRRSDPHAADIVWPTKRGRVKDAHLVKDRFVRQFVLEALVSDAALFQHHIGVIEVRSFDPGRPDGQCRTVGAALGQLFEVMHYVHLERTLHHEVLRIVARKEHLRQRHEIGPRLFAF